MATRNRPSIFEELAQGKDRMALEGRALDELEAFLWQCHSLVAVAEIKIKKLQGKPMYHLFVESEESEERDRIQ
jgi:hypothetical protein